MKTNAVQSQGKFVSYRVWILSSPRLNKDYIIETYILSLRVFVALKIPQLLKPASKIELS